MYIGKTVSPLATRMSGYRRPAESQTTNVRNNQRIAEVLSAGGAVDIYALPDNGLLHYGQFHLNLAAGLEDDLIRVINPPWNGGRKEDVAPAPTDPPIAAEQALDGVKRSFTLVLHPTYYRSGFFNVTVAEQPGFGADGQTIELYTDNSSQPLLGKINRTANMNGTPRIMGGTGLRDWFQKNAQEKSVIHVDVLSATAIRLRA
jgi:hypothetical protein